MRINPILRKQYSYNETVIKTYNVQRMYVCKWKDDHTFMKLKTMEICYSEMNSEIKMDPINIQIKKVNIEINCSMNMYNMSQQVSFRLII